MEKKTLQDVRLFFQTWDKSNKMERESILIQFIKECENMTGPDLEAHFHDCSSLFLARITSWLRVTYMFGTCLQLQLQALGIFISASTNYLMEFLEVGGILTLLEIVNLKSCSESDKAESLRLLTLIASRGRQHKEIICESYGIKVIAECLGNGQTREVQECSQNILHQLSIGNPRYQKLVYKTLIQLLSSASHNAQRLATYTLRQIQPSMETVSTSMIEPLLQLLKSLHSEVQHEADLLINEVVKFEDVQQSLLFGLVTLLKPEEMSKGKSVNEPMSSYLQQAGAARVISSFAKDTGLAERVFDEFNLLPHLLYALCNTYYPDSQVQALKCLQSFMKAIPRMQDELLKLVETPLFTKLQVKPNVIAETLSPDDIEEIFTVKLKDFT